MLSSSLFSASVAVPSGPAIVSSTLSFRLFRLPSSSATLSARFAPLSILSSLMIPFAFSRASAYSCAFLYSLNSGTSSCQLLPNSACAMLSCLNSSFRFISACPASQNSSTLSLGISCCPVAVFWYSFIRMFSVLNASLTLSVSSPTPFFSFFCALSMDSTDVSMPFVTSFCIRWKVSRSMPYIIAIVAVSSAHRAELMILSQMLSPRCTAFCAAFSSPSVILPIPPITWSRLIFLLMPFSPFSSWLALPAAFTAPPLRSFSAACVSIMPVCAASSSRAIF